MTPAQFDLLNRHAAPWLTLWFLYDFEGARTRAVESVAGGTWRHDGKAGSYGTTGKGMTAKTRDGEVFVSVTWTEVRRWVDSLPPETAQRARAIRNQGTQLQREYPPIYPGIGRAYAWDLPESTEEERERDRAALAEANATRQEQYEAWLQRKWAYDAEVKAFLESLAPSPELDLLDLLGETE